jgi:para-aminobenzoate synthetase component I
MLFMEHLFGQMGFKKMNEYGKQQIPFLSIIRFDKQSMYISPLDTINSATCKYHFSNTNQTPESKSLPISPLAFTPIPRKDFMKAFHRVLTHIKHGDSYLCNLSFETELLNEINLHTLFNQAVSKYKIWINNEFVCFSPETFIQIHGNRITTYPMKGTISSAIPNAAQTLLNNTKELAEHYTITDLLRNDLSRIAKQVQVTRFRYLDEIVNMHGKILQTSTEIEGYCDNNWHEKIGDYMDLLLPAGSISGAPKQSTINIINSVETHERGFYTGVCCLFDGINFDSFVMIRMIVKDNDRYFYKSGGGITNHSVANSEYEEIIQKIYVPIH